RRDHGRGGAGQFGDGAEVGPRVALAEPVAGGDVEREGVFGQRPGALEVALLDVGQREDRGRTRFPDPASRRAQEGEAFLQVTASNSTAARTFSKSSPSSVCTICASVEGQFSRSATTREAKCRRCASRASCSGSPTYSRMVSSSR